MNVILNEVLNKLNYLDLLSIDIETTKKIIKIAINSAKSFVICEINFNMDFNKIRDIFIDIVISEYLILIKNTDFDKNMNFDNAIKSISEGDVSISYFQNKHSKQEKLDGLILYFSNKKSLLNNFKSIRW